jgi:D-aminopeptidase
MSVRIPKSTSFFFSSDPANKAQNVSEDGSQFTVVLDTPISLPQGAMSATLSVTQASIWNTSYNISASFGNNSFYFTHAEQTNEFIIPDGLYSLSGLNAYLATQFVNLELPSSLIVISGDDATQKTILTVLNAVDTVDFT